MLNSRILIPLLILVTGILIGKAMPSNNDYTLDIKGDVCTLKTLEGETYIIPLDSLVETILNDNL